MTRSEPSAIVWRILAIVARVFAVIALTGIACLGALTVAVLALATGIHAFDPNGPVDFPALLQGAAEYVAISGTAAALVVGIARPRWLLLGFGR